LSKMVFIMVVGLWTTFNRCIAVRPKRPTNLKAQGYQTLLPSPMM
jgi:hypothetical protein